MDLLGFKKKLDVTGWHFRGMVLIKDKLVVYKLVGGQPMIHEVEKKREPIGAVPGRWRINIAKSVLTG